MKKNLTRWSAKTLFALALVTLIAATTAPVKRQQDGSVTIDTSTLKASEGCFGATPIIIHLDSLERVSKIETLPNEETPSYWQLVVDKLSHAWDGIPAAQVSTVKVDAVSGATYSSEGLISNVKTGIAYYLETKGKESD